MRIQLCSILSLATIYFTAQTATPPTGKVGINTTTPTETLDVKGKVRVQELYTEGSLTGTNNANFNATAIVTTNAQGVLGKKDIDINNLLTDSPWKRVGTTDKNAIPVSGLAMYSKYKTAIGDYSGGIRRIRRSICVKKR